MDRLSWNEASDIHQLARNFVCLVADRLVSAAPSSYFTCLFSPVHMFQQASLLSALAAAMLKFKTRDKLDERPVLDVMSDLFDEFQRGMRFCLELLVRQESIANQQ
jgi:hypothetical protein